MNRIAGVAVLMVSLLAAALDAQQLSAKWEELTAADFVKALQAANSTCALPFGIWRNTDRRGVIGTDLITRPIFDVEGDQGRVHHCLPRSYVGQILRGEASAGDDRLQHPAAAGDAEGNSRGDGAQRLPEDCHRQRPRRQHGANSVPSRRRSSNRSRITSSIRWPPSAHRAPRPPRHPVRALTATPAKARCRTSWRRGRTGVPGAIGH